MSEPIVPGSAPGSAAGSALGSTAGSAPVGRASIDGRVMPLDEARVPVTDRGFLFADSVFDTVRTYEQVPFLLGDHLDRLRRSADALAMPVPWSDDALADVVAALLDGWPYGEAVLRIMVTRGAGGAGLALPEPQSPRLVALCRPLPALPASLYEDGIQLAVPEVSDAKPSGVPAHVKSGSYLASVLALRRARALGAFEALLSGADGSWAEATTSNLFLVHGGALHTPGVADDILPGVTRALVVRLARELGLELQEALVSNQALRAADEIFVTSSIKQILPVVGLVPGNSAVGDGQPGPVTRRLMRGFVDAARTLTARQASRLTDTGRLLS